MNGSGHKARQAYKDYQEKLSHVEAKYSVIGQMRVYLADENIDRENVLVDGRTEESDDFWQTMLFAAKSAAVHRAEEEGIPVREVEA